MQVGEIIFLIKSHELSVTLRAVKHHVINDKLDLSSPQPYPSKELIVDVSLNSLQVSTIFWKIC